MLICAYTPYFKSLQGKWEKTLKNQYLYDHVVSSHVLMRDVLQMSNVCGG